MLSEKQLSFHPLEFRAPSLVVMYTAGNRLCPLLPLLELGSIFLLLKAGGNWLMSLSSISRKIERISLESKRRSSAPFCLSELGLRGGGVGSLSFGLSSPCPNPRGRSQLARQGCWPRSLE